MKMALIWMTYKKILSFFTLCTKYLGGGGHLFSNNNQSRVCPVDYSRIRFTLTLIPRNPLPCKSTKPNCPVGRWKSKKALR